MTKRAAKQTSFQVDAETFVRLGSLVPDNSGTLTPFTDDQPVGADVRKRLSKHSRALSLLASANRATRIQLFGIAGMFEYVVYFPQDDSSPVSIRGSKGQVTVDDPAATDDAMQLVADMIGASNVAATDFEAELSGPEALVYAGAIDARRRSLLRYLADGKEKVDEINSAAIASELGRSNEPFITLASIVRSVSGQRGIPAIAEIDEAYASIGRNKNLKEASDPLAASLLNIQAVFTMNAARGESKESREDVGFSCAIGGLHDLLLVENVQGVIRMESLTSRSLLAIAEKFLREAAVIPSRSSSSDVCGSCGQPRVAGNKFCGSCGAAY